jgi:TolB-like protein
MGRYTAWTNTTLRLTEATRAISQKSIAVLPFENFSRDTENAYFADGIQDEILSTIGKIGDLKVISRTSTAKYKSRPENLRQVGLELGAASVLEGSVQKAGERVRVIVQLIDAANDTHLWSETVRSSWCWSWRLAILLSTSSCSRPGARLR